MTIIITLILALGIIFNTLGVLGLLKFPDVYTRLHAATKCTTLGSILTSISVILYGILKISSAEPEYIILSIHSFIALLSLLLTNPVSAHAIARAAYKFGVKPYKVIVDKLAELENGP
ncbi:MAG: monovalent cation/H(+) antiporter subunit G [Candidatus Altiarchaeota archaeon]